MTLAIRVESAQQTQTDQWQRVTAQTSPRALKGEHRKRDPLRRSFQLDEWEVPAPRQVAHVQFDPLAAATSNLRLRSGTAAKSYKRGFRVFVEYGQSSATDKIL